MAGSIVHVAAAVIRNADNQILIARRSKEQHQGGLWEFPGGKVEAGEPVTVALQRELHEELGICVSDCRPLIQIPYHYPDKSVLLDVFEVTAFRGQAWGREGQPISWVDPQSLENYRFPAANKPILDACLLPQKIAVTPFNLDYSKVISYIERVALQGADALMLRLNGISDVSELENKAFNLVRSVQRFCEDKGLFLSVNTSCDIGNLLGLDAIHLTAERLKSLKSREEFAGRWLSASTHDRYEVDEAVGVGLNFVTLSPVCETRSHPGAKVLGWSHFSEIVSEASVPVYALGGVHLNDLGSAHNTGAQGIAAINAWVK